MRRPWFTTIACVIGLGLIVQSNMAQAGLEDTLYEKGLVNKEEWLKAKADQEKLELRESVHALMEGVPQGLSVEAIGGEMASVEGVVS
ncbi:MAG TPA: hypothetical protein VLL94_00075, partial [Nitrospiraceae bacterium]|nr:hypothetical protein [Nitrospiraceae bacterium]